MKSVIIVLALLIAGCTEQAVEKSFADPCLYCGKTYERIHVPNCNWDTTNRNGAYGDADSVYPGAVWYPDSKCQTAINFATWCQKAHPEVWREYHATHTGGE